MVKIKMFGQAALLVIVSSIAYGQDSETAFDKAYDPDTKTIRLNPDDSSGDVIFQERDFANEDNRPAGPVNLQRTYFGAAWHGIPTFFRLPVAVTPEDLKAGKVDVAIMGSPMDNGGYSRLGTSFGPQAIRTAPSLIPWGPGMLETETQVDWRGVLNVVDYGDIPVDVMSIERSLHSLRKHVGDAAKAGVIPIMIGGNHSVMYPHALGIVDAYGPKSFTSIHIDAHTDSGIKGLGHYVNIGNMNRLLVDEGFVEGKDVIQMGQRSTGTDRDNMDWYRANGVRIYFQPEIERRGHRAVLEDVLDDIRNGPGKVYLSIDYDVLDPAVAPGVTAPELGGWTTRQLQETIKAIAIAGDLVGAEFVEYNPFTDDHARTTGIVASKMIRELLAALALKEQGITDPFYYHPDALGATRGD